MARNTDKRIKAVEAAVNPPDDKVHIIVDWGDDDVLIVDGAEMTRQDYEKKFPDRHRLVLGWGDDNGDDDPGHIVKRVGFDLGKV